MNDIRIVFMGTPFFASNILEGLINNNYNIVLVVTQPDKPFGRKRVLKASECKEIAMKNSIDVLCPNSLKDEYKRIFDYKPDLIITCAYGQFLPKGLLDFPKYKSINIHGSLLPKYRGGAPIQRCIMNGDKYTGISIMFMNEHMDEGDILYQNKIKIDINDTSTSLFNKMSNLGREMIIDFLPKFLNGDYIAIKQDNKLSCVAGNIKKEEEHINFNDDVEKVHNHIRALLDNPGCYFVVDDKKYKIHKSAFVADNNSTPSYIYGFENDYIKIGTNNGFILIYLIQAESKNVCNAKEFNNGLGKKIIGKQAC